MLDPDIQALLEAMAAGGFRLPDPLDAAALRALLDAPIPAPPIPIAERRALRIETPSSVLDARLYRPSEKVSPLVVFFHGGGWVHGTLDTHDRLAAALAAGADCAVLTVAYRLAPEHPFPAAFEDAVAATRWAQTHAAALGVDASAFALAGDSAGGNLAAAAALALAQDANPPAHQVLLYPALDGRCASASYAGQHAGFLSSAQMRWYWDQYAPGETRLDARASPSLEAALEGASPATIIVAGNDPLHDEGVAYAQALERAGVAAALHDFPTAIHGFVSLFGMAAIADEALGIATSALRRALKRS